MVIVKLKTIGLITWQGKARQRAAVWVSSSSHGLVVYDLSAAIADDLYNITININY